MPPIPLQASSSRQKLIDELGELRRRVTEAEVRIAAEVGVDQVRLDELEETILGWFAKDPPEQPRVQEGEQYFVEVTPCEFRRDLPIKAKREIFKRLKAKLGADPLGLFSITQEAVKAHLGGAVIDEQYTKLRTGPRKLKLIAKAPPAKPAIVKPAKKAA